MELTHLGVMPCERLRIVCAGRFRRHAHGQKGASEIALQLARVRHPRIRRGGWLERRHSIEGCECRVVLTAFDVSVADHTPDPRVV
jgi:hypothetical protein